jgi:protein phosphatase
MLRVAHDHFSRSDPGRHRRANEDSYFARSPIFVVADGMGGAQAGEVASRMAVEAFEPGLADGGGSAEERLAARVQEANARIHAMSQSADDRAGMGTTLTAAHVGETDVAVAHVGDSRAYRLRDSELERLTEDHSLVEEMRRRGQLTAEEADEHPQRSIITRALGPEPEVAVDTHSWRGEAGDVYLLCSDGLTSMVPEPRVAEILESASSLREAGQALIDAANAAGGRDNITVLLFRLEEVGEGRDAAADQPTTVGARGGLTTADVRAAQQAEAPAPTATASGPATTATRRLEPRDPAPAPARRRRGRLRRLAGPLVLMAVLVVPVFVGGYIASQAVYFIGTDEDGYVTMYRGLPYDLPAGLDLYTVNYVSGVRADTLSARRRTDLLDHKLRSRDDAADLVRRLERGQVAS